ncbi:PREDICTED: trypsin beta-like [Ceratosolen solmsi marchali]|uniref:Trypsin beta-like n=1 Tax=Ceratosolen solmsi marchali TaxID=326594 RepID=A0AAJ6YQ80_9HYME|nr:PREDICTED: trypsin beta-like [Ceratosolen solmsi marchali]
MGIFLLFITFVFQLNAYVLGDDPPFETNIVGGQIADIEDYPYQVAVIQDERLWCGGSIANPNYVLTAGHCVFMAIMPLFVHAGSRYWYNPGSVHEVDFNITYTTEISTTGDVALLHVSKTFNYDKTCQPIPLFGSYEKPQVGALAYVTGWGITDNGNIAEQLHQITTRIIDQNTCNNIYKDTIIGNLHPGEICANADRMGPCRGDSGSPMIIDGRLAGLVSMGIGCLYPKYPAIYVDVGYFRDWIITNMK